MKYSEIKEFAQKRNAEFDNFKHELVAYEYVEEIIEFWSNKRDRLCYSPDELLQSVRGLVKLYDECGLIVQSITVEDGFIFNVSFVLDQSDEYINRHK